MRGVWPLDEIHPIRGYLWFSQKGLGCARVAMRRLDARDLCDETRRARCAVDRKSLPGSSPLRKATPHLTRRQRGKEKAGLFFYDDSAHQSRKKVLLFLCPVDVW